MNEEDKVKKQWLRDYDALAARFSEIYLKTKERGRKAMTVALAEAEEELVAAKNFTAERGEQLKAYLARDLDQTIQDAKRLGDLAKPRLDPSRLEAGALASIAGMFEWTGKALLDVGGKAKEKLTCKTGEITSAGTLTCQSCAQQLHLEKTAHIPPCPKCKQTVFTKSY